MEYVKELVLRHIFVIGGAKSGKSRFALATAEKMLEDTGAKGLFIATATVTDEEMALRIKRHQKERQGHWVTVEEPLEVAQVISKASQYGVIVLDCLTLWVSNVLFQDKDSFECRSSDLCVAIKGASCPVILVSNEVGMGIVPMDPVSRAFRDMAGRLNQRIAAICDDVYLVAAGLPLMLKGNLK